MKYETYSTHPQSIEKLFLKTGVSAKTNTVIKVNLEPDPEGVPTDWRTYNNNYFKNISK